MSIDWDEFKFFKQYGKKSDNFETLLSFLEQYCKLNTPREIFLVMLEDDIAKMMLQKRDINSVGDMERYLFRGFNATKPREDS